MGKCELLTELGLQVWEAQINCNCITAISIQCLIGVRSEYSNGKFLSFLQKPFQYPFLHTVKNSSRLIPSAGK